MKYYSRVIVNRSPQEISKTINEDLGYNGELSIHFLKSLGLKDGDTFYVYEDENTKRIILRYTTSRLETEEEVKARVDKEEDYNRRYEEYHAKKINNYE